ncbi:uncharacterized protein V1516DRAFT_647841 [Lipomyces oligophaga]|uniref:uncharacterized protein n=1 Tax=Lipomyces oligophaga TaxID=45792 RepID=UPI0034CE396E
MYSYLDHILESFNTASGWDINNQYEKLTRNSRDLLDFQIPLGFNLNVSSLSAGSFASSYSIRNLSGAVDGDLSYYFATPNNVLTANRLISESADLNEVLCGYHHPQMPDISDRGRMREEWKAGQRVDVPYSLLYGKLYLPSNLLEALFVRQFTPTSQAVVSAVTGNQIKNGSAILTQYQYNPGRWCTELLYGSDETLLGLRGLYNFGLDSRSSSSVYLSDPQPSWLSAGGEIYYCASNKAAGVSTALRYTTSSPFVQIPVTMTVTLNPIMGQLSAAYAVKSATSTTFASRFDFNVFSYESDLTLGCELWRGRSDEVTATVAAKGDSSTQFSRSPLQTEIQSDYPVDLASNGNGDNQTIALLQDSVWKLRMSTSSPSIRVLWEGRIKSFLFSFGTDIDLRPGHGIQSFGLQLQYAS